MIRNIFNRKVKQVALLFIIVSLFSFAPFHHGWSSYDQTKTLNLKGQILEYSYDNPHGMLKFKADDKTWTVVLAPPSRMESRGLQESMLKKGTKATIVGYPHLKTKDEMRAERPGAATIEKASTPGVSAPIVDEMRTKVEDADRERAEQAEVKKAEDETDRERRATDRSAGRRQRKTARTERAWDSEEAPAAS